MVLSTQYSLGGKCSQQKCAHNENDVDGDDDCLWSLWWSSQYWLGCWWWDRDQIGQSAPDWEHVHTTLLIDNDRNHSSCQTQPFPITKWEKIYNENQNTLALKCAPLTFFTPWGHFETLNFSGTEIDRDLAKSFFWKEHLSSYVTNTKFHQYPQ